MSDETKRVLEMVVAGKITVDEGERLLGVLGVGQSALPPPDEAERLAPRFLKIEGSSAGKDGKDESFRMRVPLDLIRAGLKLRALIPETKRDKINDKLRKKGIEGDVFEMSDDKIESLIRTLGELEIEGVDGEDGFRLYLE